MGSLYSRSSCIANEVMPWSCSSSSVVMVAVAQMTLLCDCDCICNRRVSLRVQRTFKNCGMDQGYHLPLFGRTAGHLCAGWEAQSTCAQSRPATSIQRCTTVNIVAQGYPNGNARAPSCRESGPTIPASASLPASYEQLTLTVCRARLNSGPTAARTVSPSV